MASLTKLLTGAKITKAWLDSLVDRVNPVMNVTIAPATNYTGTIRLDRLGNLRRVDFRVNSPSTAPATGNLNVGTLDPGDRPSAEADDIYLQISSTGVRKAELCRVDTTGAIWCDGSPGASATLWGSVTFVVA